MEIKRMIVEVGREVQNITGNVTGYLGILGIRPRTYGWWVREYADGNLVEAPPQPLTPEEINTLGELREEMKTLAHHRHYTFGLPDLWKKYRGKIRRETFRRMAREVRVEVNRDRRNQLLRYEFTHPDVAHSIDFSEVPRELPGGAKRYLLKIMDECTRLTLKRAVTDHKGAGVGANFVNEHIREGFLPLVFKYDREFAVPQFEALLVMNKVVPLPSPKRYPPFNGKKERSFKDVQLWLGVFESDHFWSYTELVSELDLCFKRTDEIEPRENLGGRTRQQAYRELGRAQVDRDQFFRDAVLLRRAILQRPGVTVDPDDAWRIAAKETLKKYGLVQYSRPPDV